MDHAGLIEIARAARERAYAPYSRFKVGAALLARSGRVYAGCNVENASYPAGICAERCAVAKAVSEGESEFSAIAVVGDTEGPCAPCGICRQVLAEFGTDIDVVMANLKGDVKVVRVEDLLPGAFTGRDMSPTAGGGTREG
ncbi:MAG: cytidine deaminase [Firmicutes bacterium]|jgi:cytidine deaminase|nr:cytidine deaminase [Bacillota bacterium]MDH7495027.1 cytidine deaminase [Bacillota bacterium]